MYIINIRTNNHIFVVIITTFHLLRLPGLFSYLYIQLPSGKYDVKILFNLREQIVLILRKSRLVL